MDVLLRIEHCAQGLKGEKGLIAAIIIRSILDLRAPQQKIARKARKFFFYRGTDPFSFIWICEQLDMEPHRLINYLHELKLLH